MDRDAAENCRVMTKVEVAKEFRSALQIGAARTKGGRMTVYELVHGMGLAALADAMAENLCLYMVFLKRPPASDHRTPSRAKDR
jgi:hypothetical protein